MINGLEETEGERPRIVAAIGSRLSYANVMATIAVFGVIATGGAFAASQIGPRDIAKDAVRAKHIKKNQIKAKHVAKNTVGTPKIRDRAVTAEKLADGLEGLQGPRGEQGDQGATGPSGFAANCNEGLAPGDLMVRVGPLCIDRYEASIWTARTGGSQITGGIESIPCKRDGSDCQGRIFARSVAGLQPRVSITWFQAQQALANSGKRLPSNAEWQMAAAGTPDGAPCNVSSSAPVNAGSIAGCSSAHGVSDMVGNVWEWVADWVPASTHCPGWGSVGDFSSDDFMCLSGASTTATGPAALFRGGGFDDGSFAGPFAVDGNARPQLAAGSIGFRGAR